MKKQASDYVYASRYYDENNILLFNGKYPTEGKLTLGADEILIHHENLETLFGPEIKALEVDEKNRVRALIHSMEKTSYEKSSKKVAKN